MRLRGELLRRMHNTIFPVKSRILRSELSSVSNSPTSADFQRNLLAIVRKAREQVRADDQRIKADHAARGLGPSGALIIAIADRFEEVHAEVTEAVMHLIRHFAGRSQLTPSELGAMARGQLENFAAELAAHIPSFRGPTQNATQQVRVKSEHAFRERTDSALRDIEIGFIGGRDVAGSQEQNIQANAFQLLEAIELATRGSPTPVILEQLRDLKMTQDEAQAAFHYLKGKRLIEANFGIFYSARVSAAGHDAIRDAEKAPDKASPAFPAITYNNYMTVHSMTGSNVQQGTTSSQITATQTITTQELVAGVRRLIDQLDRLLPASDFPAPLQSRTRDATAELRSAVAEPKPSGTRLHKGLDSLKNIMEDAAGHLVAVGVISEIAQLMGTGVAH